MQLASPNPLVIKVFFGQGHPLQKALWLSPAPSQNFRGTFAKISPSADPSFWLYIYVYYNYFIYIYNRIYIYIILIL
jgi:hypothetical protein